MPTTTIKVTLVLEEVTEDHEVEINEVGWEATQGQAIVRTEKGDVVTILDPEATQTLVDSAETVTLEKSDEDQ